ncbi:MAG: Uma2 family endonuclease [Bryobacteraceae bacterium]|nr:Uma2 family endonuclease [Bryobacteraceae bacterium]
MSEQEYNFNGNAHGPDLSFFGPDKVAILAVDRRVQPFVPDLAIEVASPNDKFAALLRKVHRYRDCGTSEVWVIEPELRKVFVFSSLGDRVLSATDQLKTPLIPDFTQPVSDLFSQFPQ